MSNISTTVRMDEQLKSEVNSTLDALGLSFNTFIVMASKQLVYNQALPFDVKVPEVHNTVLHKLFIEEEAIRLGLLEDDSVEISDDYFDRKLEKYL